MYGSLFARVIPSPSVSPEAGPVQVSTDSCLSPQDAASRTRRERGEGTCVDRAPKERPAFTVYVRSIFKRCLPEALPHVFK